MLSIKKEEALLGEIKDKINKNCHGKGMNDRRVKDDLLITTYRNLQYGGLPNLRAQKLSDHKMLLYQLLDLETLNIKEHAKGETDASKA